MHTDATVNTHMTETDPPNGVGCKACRRWLSAHSVRLAWFALVVAVLHPPHGFGFTLCWFHQTTGVPCPGCGLTRSLSCAVRGMLTESWAYHPFGPILLGVFAVIATIGVLPGHAQRRVFDCISRHAGLANAAYVLLVTSFLTYGLYRAVMHLI